ncbi:MAG TPA: hypothetical protein VFX59_07430 [Polyangiales bacterium]|nr:hypothetical protein [Polyangiales bacterium]
MTEEVLIPVATVISPLTGVRSTLIQSSLHTLRVRGHFERYLQLVDPACKASLLESLAPEWLNPTLAHAHYAACDALELGADELLSIGEAVGDRIQGAFIGTLVRRARAIGLTPWVMIPQFGRLRERLLLGGSMQVNKVGPKDITVDMRVLPLCEYAYFRAAFCGVVGTVIKLGAGRSVVVRIANSSGFAKRCVFRCSWV